MTRPGLAKSRGLPLVLARSGSFVRATDARWRELFDAADTVSEGSVRDEKTGRVWYGSTSLILSVPPGAGAGVDPALLATLVARDVHIRLRAVRIAHREACARAPCRLGRFTCEIRVEPDARGVRIDVDGQAPLIERRARSKSAR
ncbi:MAG TPA: hypothetical protein VHS09_15240 [Polyangiaceae bacterium]|nr:hypothetical protein [Polyangiaceae bacterium]